MCREVINPTWERVVQVQDTVEKIEKRLEALGNALKYNLALIETKIDQQFNHTQNTLPKIEKKVNQLRDNLLTKPQAGWEDDKPQPIKMMSAEIQAHYDRLIQLAESLRKANYNGRHDGVGNVIVSIDLYQRWARETCDSIDWILKETGMEEYA